MSQAVVIATGVTTDGRREVLASTRRLRGRGVLDRVHAWLEGPRPGRGAAGDQRRPHRPQGRDRLGPARLGVATVPGALHAQRPRGRPERQLRDGRRGVRTIFAQHDAEHCTSSSRSSPPCWAKQLPKVEQMLREAATTCWPSPGSRSAIRRSTSGSLKVESKDMHCDEMPRWTARDRLTWLSLTAASRPRWPGGPAIRAGGGPETIAGGLRAAFRPDRPLGSSPAGLLGSVWPSRRFTTRTVY